MGKNILITCPSLNEFWNFQRNTKNYSEFIFPIEDKDNKKQTYKCIDYLYNQEIKIDEIIFVHDKTYFIPKNEFTKSENLKQYFYNYFKNIFEYIFHSKKTINDIKEKIIHEIEVSNDDNQKRNDIFNNLSELIINNPDDNFYVNLLSGSRDVKSPLYNICFLFDNAWPIEQELNKNNNQGRSNDEININYEKELYQLIENNEDIEETLDNFITLYPNKSEYKDKKLLKEFMDKRANKYTIMNEVNKTAEKHKLISAINEYNYEYPYTYLKNCANKELYNEIARNYLDSIGAPDINNLLDVYKNFKFLLKRELPILAINELENLLNNKFYSGNKKAKSPKIEFFNLGVLKKITKINYADYIDFIQKVKFPNLKRKLYRYEVYNLFSNSTNNLNTDKNYIDRNKIAIGFNIVKNNATYIIKCNNNGDGYSPLDIFNFDFEKNRNLLLFLIARTIIDDYDTIFNLKRDANNANPGEITKFITRNYYLNLLNDFKDYDDNYYFDRINNADVFTEEEILNELNISKDELDIYIFEMVLKAANETEIKDKKIQNKIIEKVFDKMKYLYEIRDIFKAVRNQYAHDEQYLNLYNNNHIDSKTINYIKNHFHIDDNSKSLKIFLDELDKIFFNFMVYKPEGKDDFLENINKKLIEQIKQLDIKFEAKSNEKLSRNCNRNILIANFSNNNPSLRGIYSQTLEILKRILIDYPNMKNGVNVVCFLLTEEYKNYYETYKEKIKDEIHYINKNWDMKMISCNVSTYNINNIFKYLKNIIYNKKLDDGDKTIIEEFDNIFLDLTSGLPQVTNALEMFLYYDQMNDNKMIAYKCPQDIKYFMKIGKVKEIGGVNMSEIAPPNNNSIQATMNNKDGHSIHFLYSLDSNKKALDNYDFNTLYFNLKNTYDRKLKDAITNLYNWSNCNTKELKNASSLLIALVNNYYNRKGKRIEIALLSSGIIIEQLAKRMIQTDDPNYNKNFNKDYFSNTMNIIFDKGSNKALKDINKDDVNNLNYLYNERNKLIHKYTIKAQGTTNASDIESKWESITKIIKILKDKNDKTIYEKCIEIQNQYEENIQILKQELEFNIERGNNNE